MVSDKWILLHESSWRNIVVVVGSADLPLTLREMKPVVLGCKHCGWKWHWAASFWGQMTICLAQKQTFLVALSLHSMHSKKQQSCSGSPGRIAFIFITYFLKRFPLTSYTSCPYPEEFSSQNPLYPQNNMCLFCWLPWFLIRTHHNFPKACPLSSVSQGPQL